MAMPVEAVLAGQQSIQRVDQVVIRARADLDHDDAGRGMRHEHRQEAVLGFDIGQERGTGRGQVGDAARGSGADRQKPRLYGKMLRRASRIRPRPPIAGADS